jgi:hypothetical protein
MNPVVREALRRQWPVFGAVSLFVVFAAAHLMVFVPAARRYEAALKRAGDFGLAGANQSSQTLPPRVFALLTDNAVPGMQFIQGASSGVLTAGLLDDLNKRAAAHGLEVLVTEPGLLTQLPQAVQVRAHLKLRGRYTDFVTLLDDLSRSGSLTALDRFTLMPTESNREIVEVWMSRSILKQPERRP